MTRKQQEALLQKQLGEMLKDMAHSLQERVPRVLRSGMVAEDLLKGLDEDGNYLLAKAIMDGYMRERPYGPLHSGHKKAFENVFLAV